MSNFHQDPFPGRPKILFIGFAQSTHTRSWIDLLDDAQMNVRLYGMPPLLAPEDWRVKTYIPFPIDTPINPDIRFAPDKWQMRYRWHIKRTRIHYTKELLLEIIRDWQPDIIQIIGIDAAGYFFQGIVEEFNLKLSAQIIVQILGGSDITLKRLDPEFRPKLIKVLQMADILITDTPANVDYVAEMGISADKFASIGPVPCTGGIEVEALRSQWQHKTSERGRVILFPKAYECPWSVALPVFEAIKNHWQELMPFEMHILAMTTEATRMWYWALPQEVRDITHVYFSRVDHAEVLRLMLKSRIMLAPSLIDGMPNVTFEAMAAGAFPILSPLETITPFVENEKNVLFARNLYIEELATALKRALDDDVLVDTAAENNLKLVRQAADRTLVRQKVVGLYEALTAK